MITGGNTLKHGGGPVPRVPPLGIAPISTDGPPQAWLAALAAQWKRALYLLYLPDQNKYITSFVPSSQGGDVDLLPSANSVVTVVETAWSGVWEAFQNLTMNVLQPIKAGDLLLMTAKLNGPIGGGDATIQAGLGLPWVTLHQVNSRGIWYCVAPADTNPGTIRIHISGYNRTVCYVNLRGVPSFDVGVSDFYPSTSTDPMTVSVGSQILTMSGSGNGGVIGGVLIPSGATDLASALQIVLVPGWAGGNNPHDSSWTKFINVFDHLGIFHKGTFVPSPPGVLPFLVIPKGDGQSVSELDGSASISEATVKCNDPIGTYPFQQLRTMLADQSIHLLGSPALLSLGFPGMALDDFVRLATLQVTKAGSDKEGWIYFNLADTQRSLKSYIWTDGGPTAWTPGGPTPVQPAGPAFADNGLPISDNNPRYLSGNPMDLLLVACQNELGIGQDNPSDPTSWKIYTPGDDTTLINPNLLLDVPTILALRDGQMSGDWLEFTLKAQETGKDWIETEILRPFCLYTVVLSTGMMTFKTMKSPPAVSPAVWDDDSVDGIPGIDRWPILNVVQARMNTDNSGSTTSSRSYKDEVTYKDDFSIAQFRQELIQQIELTGLRTRRGANARALIYSNRVFRRHANGTPVYSVDVQLRNLTVELGEQVSFSHALLPDLERVLTGKGNLHAAQLAAAPLHLYALDEEFGVTAKDVGTAPLNGTYAGGFTLGGLPLESDLLRAALLDGATGEVDLPFSDVPGAATAFTVEILVRQTANEFDPTHGFRIVANDHSSAAPFAGFELASGQIVRFGCSNGSEFYEAQYSAALALNVVHHLVGTFDGKKVCLYVNGVLAASHPFTGTYSPGGYNITIGRDPAYSDSDFFPGYVQSAAFYSTALTADRVLAHYVGIFQAGKTLGVFGALTEVIDRQPNYSEGKLTYSLLDLRFTQQTFAYQIAPGGTPDWTASNGVQQGTLLYLADDSGLMSDGAQGPTIF